MDRMLATRLQGTTSLPLTLLYGCTIFLSAFLLFLVQPLIGKRVLPWFGGSAAIWSTCLLFFQLVLLLGYLYAHWSIKTLSPRRQAALHVLLLASSIAALPIVPSTYWKPDGGEDPTGLILGLLTATIGLPYFLLSTTGPLLQAWFAREKPEAVPYRLFALSNLGSMLGLLSYPVIFEPALAMSDMATTWAAGYVIFALLCVILAIRAQQTARPTHASPSTATVTRPSAAALLSWILLAACPAILLMGVTSHLTQNVAPVPFLWVLPLALYLLSFILSFEGRRWYQRRWYLPVFIVFLIAMSIDLAKPLVAHRVWFPLILYCIGLFVSCMVCHGELSRRKPDPAHLTAFYLMIALGGAIGGIFVALAAPRLFSGNYELPASAIMTGVLIATIIHADARGPVGQGTVRRAWSNAMACAVALVAVFTLASNARQSSTHRIMARNFYGTLHVDDVTRAGYGERQLVHGTILHGSQYLALDRRHWPTTYYGENSGVGMAILATRRAGQQQRLGVIGLGTGTTAAYGRGGDYYRFYEINPLVEQLARSQFTFLDDSRATVETAIGDARQSLEQEQGQQFDVLIVDAFTGDSIPVHLLTREAFAVYFRHVRSGGLLAVHISNRNLDLAPVVRHASDFFAKVARQVRSKPAEERALLGSTWILVSDSAEPFNADPLRGVAAALDDGAPIRPWTDDYSSIYPILK